MAETEKKTPSVRLSVSIEERDYIRLERLKAARVKARSRVSTQDLVSGWITEKLDEAERQGEI